MQSHTHINTDKLLPVGLTYSGTTRVANLAGSVVEAAAHQIALQTWWMLSFFCTPLSLAAQAIIPRELSAGRYGL